MPPIWRYIPSKKQNYKISWKVVGSGNLLCQEGQESQSVCKELPSSEPLPAGLQGACKKLQNKQSVK